MSNAHIIQSPKSSSLLEYSTTNSPYPSNDHLVKRHSDSATSLNSHSHYDNPHQYENDHYQSVPPSISSPVSSNPSIDALPVLSYPTPFSILLLFLLILFSWIGTLMRIILTELFNYTGSIVPSPYYANFVSCFILGFVDRSRVYIGRRW
jgi:hypothetical protein